MSILTPEQVLALVPQQQPFRFVDRILELDSEHILGEYTWKDEDCRNYIPGKLLAPQFKMLEMAAQIGNVAWCIYHMSLTVTPEEMRQLVGVFTQVDHGEFLAPVRAGEKVACLAEFGEAGYFRGNKLLSEVRMQISGGPEDGRDVFSGTISGMWVPKSSERATA